MQVQLLVSLLQEYNTTYQNEGLVVTHLILKTKLQVDFYIFRFLNQLVEYKFNFLNQRSQLIYNQSFNKFIQAKQKNSFCMFKHIYF